MDQERSEIPISALADPTDMFPAAARGDAWRQSEPGSEMARRLEEKLRDAGWALAFPREANALFVHLPDDVAERLRACGWQFYKFFEPDVYRLMCSWSITAQDIQDFAADL